MDESFYPAEEEDTPLEPRERRERRPARRRERRIPVLKQGRVRVGAVIALAAALALIIWAIVGSGGGGKSTPAAPGGSAPVALSFAGLKTFVGALHQPIYWIGKRQGVTYELTQAGGGKVYVRYLPAGVKAGDPNTYLTVGTYPLPNAFAVTRQISGKNGTVAIPLAGGAVGYYSPNNQTNAYIAFSGSDYQMEVYDPTPGVARTLVAQGRVKSVPGAAPAGINVTAVTPAGLRSLATRLGQSIFWAGAQAGFTYEVRQLASGFVYVRYLPKGVAVGDPRPYRTIATYPMENGFAATQGLAKGSSDHATLRLPGGGIGVYDKSKVGNVYVAFPGSAYQVEVFDPTPKSAYRLVAAKRIVAAR